MAAVMPNEKSPIRKSGGKIRLAKQLEVDEGITSLKTKLRLSDSENEKSSAALTDSKTLSQVQNDERSKKCKYKTLVRSHALCGDDDTRLSPLREEKQSCSNSSSGISRDSSSELYTDSTGINLEDFIIATLHKNAKDRQMILNLEEELITFVQDASKQVHRFPPMSSYNRMLVHRIGAFFGLDHNVDQSGTAVVVNKTKSIRL
ncbi:unnamed protein product [Soboliphyme baturini]|uniref:R3H domain-containing protein n=1 Tax=Soboliphyme baturini TaxID=241478 RepID=A0A183J300_9BILA|nr:unnamed protein product [Soboliphyme baturini]